jgi:hypothetical protein
MELKGESNNFKRALGILKIPQAILACSDLVPFALFRNSYDRRSKLGSRSFYLYTFLDP